MTDLPPWPKLVAVNGVGRAKLVNYGAACLEIIRDYCRQHGLEAVG
jgi:hypothetical protein